MELNFVLVILGLVICFGGIYFRKFVAGAMGLMWGAILGLAAVVVMTLASDGVLFLIYNLKETSTLVIVVICALVVCVLSAWLDKLCATINAFLSSLLVYAVLLLILGADFESGLIVLLLLALSCITSAIAYRYYDIAYVLLTAFSGAFLASVGGVGMVEKEDAEGFLRNFIWGDTEAMGTILVATIVLGMIGCFVQSIRFRNGKKTGAGFGTMVVAGFGRKAYDAVSGVACVLAQGIQAIWTTELKDELRAEKKIVAISLLVGLGVPLYERLVYSASMSYVVFCFIEAIVSVITGIFIAGLIYLGMCGKKKLYVLLQFPYLLGCLLFTRHAVRYSFFYVGAHIAHFVLVGLVILLLIKVVQDKRIQPIVTIIGASIAHSFVIPSIRYMRLYVHIDFAVILFWLAVILFTYLLIGKWKPELYCKLPLNSDELTQAGKKLGTDVRAFWKRINEHIKNNDKRNIIIGLVVAVVIVLIVVIVAVFSSSGSKQQSPNTVAGQENEAYDLDYAEEDIELSEDDLLYFRTILSAMEDRRFESTDSLTEDDIFGFFRVMVDIPYIYCETADYIPYESAMLNDMVYNAVEVTDLQCAIEDILGLSYRVGTTAYDSGATVLTDRAYFTTNNGRGGYGEVIITDCKKRGDIITVTYDFYSYTTLEELLKRTSDYVVSAVAEFRENNSRSDYPYQIISISDYTSVAIEPADVSSMDYIDEYADILFEYLDTSEFPARFQLTDLNGDAIYELLIAEGESHVSGVRIYGYVDGATCEIGAVGSWGMFSLGQDTHTIISNYSGMGASTNEVYIYEDGMLRLEKTFGSFGAMDDGPGIYKIDGIEVSASEYQMEWEKVLYGDQFYGVGYSTGTELTAWDVEELRNNPDWYIVSVDYNYSDSTSNSATSADTNLLAFSDVNWDSAEFLNDYPKEITADMYEEGLVHAYTIEILGNGDLSFMLVGMADTATLSVIVYGDDETVISESRNCGEGCVISIPNVSAGTIYHIAVCYENKPSWYTMAWNIE